MKQMSMPYNNSLMNEEEIKAKQDIDILAKIKAREIDTVDFS